MLEASNHPLNVTYPVTRYKRGPGGLTVELSRAPQSFGLNRQASPRRLQRLIDDQ